MNAEEDGRREERPKQVKRRKKTVAITVVITAVQAGEHQILQYPAQVTGMKQSRGNNSSLPN